MNCVPIFPTIPAALDWAKTQNWGALIVTDTLQGAEQYMQGARVEKVPVFLVEMRVSYRNVIQCNNDMALAKHLGIHVEQHDPLAAWDKGKWEIGFEAYVGGERREDYGDKKWKMLKS